MVPAITRHSLCAGIRTHSGFIVVSILSILPATKRFVKYYLHNTRYIYTLCPDFHCAPHLQTQRPLWFSHSLQTWIIDGTSFSLPHCFVLLSFFIQPPRRMSRMVSHEPSRLTN